MKTAVISILTVFTTYILISWGKHDVSQKINGVSLVAPRHSLVPEDFVPIKKINANWTAVIPYAFSRAEEPGVYFNHERQWRGERKEGICEQIILARQNGFKVMLKPHVWVRGQGWPGEFTLTKEEDWETWESDYSRYVLHCAQIADSLDVELFSIGTEFRKVVLDRPEFWVRLIAEVRKVYSGKLTYASNWDNYHNVTFWPDLDYIGVDAYFPISDKEDATITDLINGWKVNAEKLKNLAGTMNKPILFTEFGYQSVVGTAGNHWELSSEEVDMNAQAEAYEALFQTFWGERWFAGGFFWKWHFRIESGGLDDPNFTPQGKPAQDVIERWYAKHQ